jgi:hypothetical protein
VHGSKEFLPYTDPGQTTVDPAAAENMLAAIEGIAMVLDKYDVKATWEFLPAGVKGLVEYQGANNIIAELAAGGHEIAAHAHRLNDVSAAVEALESYTGISPVTTSGFIAQVSGTGESQAQSAMSLAVRVPVDLGLSVGTVNLTPGGELNNLSGHCNNQFGLGNDMWEETGNLLFPWRPDYLHEDICSHIPNGAMAFVDHAPLTSFVLPNEDGPPDVLGSDHFAQLQTTFDAALSYMAANQPERTAAWGFVTHIIEYAVGSQAENPPDPRSLEALDSFLAHVDAKQDQGLVIYATAAEIAENVP